MQLHGNAALSLNQRRRLARRVVEEGWTLAEAIALLWRSGLRITEALKLKPADVDEREGTGASATARAAGIAWP